MLATISQGNPQYFPHAAKYAFDKDPRIRGDTMVYLRPIGTRSLPILVAGANDRDVTVRHRAIDQIYQLGSTAKPAVPTLEKRMDDPDARVRDLAAFVIKYVDPERYEALKTQGRIR
jgi:HEAT repeat protein